MPRSKEGNQMIGTRDLQTTMLEGYGMAPLNLNMSAINNKSMFGKAPLLRRTMSKKTESKFFITSQKGGGGSFHRKRQKTWPWSHIFWCWLCCLWRWKTWGHMPWKKQRQVLRPMMTAVALAETSVGGHHPQCPNGGSGPFSGRGRELQGATQDNGHSLEHYLTWAACSVTHIRRNR